MATEKFDCVYTDTFGGEANFAWVRRTTIEVSDGDSQRTIMRAAKKSLGLTGVRGVTTDHGDEYVFRPYGVCTVLFVTFCDTDTDD